MREIIFRGKEKDTPYGPLWRYGDLTHNFNSVLINGRLVDPDTVGQFTGLTYPRQTDTLIHKIWEGDLIRVRNFVGVVAYDCDGFVVKFSDFSIPLFRLLIDTLSLEHIGNIHDNPELLYNDKQSDKSEEVES